MYVYIYLNYLSTHSYFYANSIYDLWVFLFYTRFGIIDLMLYLQNSVTSQRLF